MVRYNSEGIDPKKKADLLPLDWYVLKIVDVQEDKDKNGFPQAKLKCEVVNNEAYNGRIVKYSVTFLPADNKFAWKAVKFLQTMGEPIGGDHDHDIKSWEFKKFEGQVGPGSFVNDKGETIEFNQVKNIRPHGTPVTQDDISFP